MFKGFNNGMKSGLLIMGISGIIMALEVFLERPVIDLVAWLFFVGMGITLISSIISLRKNSATTIPFLIQTISPFFYQTNLLVRLVLPQKSYSRYKQ